MVVAYVLDGKLALHIACPFALVLTFTFFPLKLNSISKFLMREPVTELVAVTIMVLSSQVEPDCLMFNLMWYNHIC